MKKKMLIAVSCMILITVALVICFSVFLYSYARKNVNTEYDEKLFDSAIGASSTVFYANSDNSGSTYNAVRIDFGGNSKKIYYSIDEISDLLIDGFIAVEDRGFYSHSGVDLKRTLYAAANYVFGGQDKFGASTITQQVVKNISGDNQPSVRRKITEMLRAYNIEKKHTKSQILEVYLNIAPMSSGIVGVGAAAELYFGKSPSELSASEAATIIGITNAPTAYDPYKNPEKCISKRNVILKVMYDCGVINEAEYLEAVDDELTLTDREDMIDSWFIETVTADVVKDYAEKYKISESLARVLIRSGGYSVYTTENIEIQNILESFFEDEANFPSAIKNGLNYSMVVTDPHSGDVLGIIGRVGKKSGNRLSNHAEIPHVPASALKPITLYAPMIDSGSITWSSVFDDVPLSFTSTSDGYKEFPKNSPNVYDGLMTVKDALRLSKNTVATRLCKMRGVNSVFDTLTKDYGFDTLVDSYTASDGSILTDRALSPLALGQLTRGVTLRKLTEAYTTFANDGVKNTSRTYCRVTDKDGKAVLENEPPKKRIMKTETARIMNQLLSQVTASGTAKSLTLKNITSVAGKTGTSGGGYDKIFVGYTPYVTAGIWCGYDNGGISLGENGKTAMNIWDHIMTKICTSVYADRLDDTFCTEGLVYAPYCMDSGLAYSQSCIYDPRGSRLEYGYFTPDTVPASTCRTHVIVNYDTVGKGIAIGDQSTDNAKVSLIKNESRSFPREVYITDAEYVYRDIKNCHESICDGMPYFYCELDEGEYAGISNKKKQFNSFPIQSSE